MICKGVLMSIDFGLRCGGPQVIEYTVREENGCTFISCPRFVLKDDNTLGEVNTCA